jgi:hypothetical protein
VADPGREASAGPVGRDAREEEWKRRVAVAGEADQAVGLRPADAGFHEPQDRGVPVRVAGRRAVAEARENRAMGECCVVAGRTMDRGREVGGRGPCLGEGRERVAHEPQRRLRICDRIVGLGGAKPSLLADLPQAEGFRLGPGQRRKPEAVDVGNVGDGRPRRLGRQMRQVELAEIVPDDKARAGQVGDELCDAGLRVTAAPVERRLRPGPDRPDRLDPGRMGAHLQIDRGKRREVVHNVEPGKAVHTRIDRRPLISGQQQSTRFAPEARQNCG